MLESPGLAVMKDLVAASEVVSIQFLAQPSGLTLLEYLRVGLLVKDENPGFYGPGNDE